MFNPDAPLVEDSSTQNPIESGTARHQRCEPLVARICSPIGQRWWHLRLGQCLYRSRGEEVRVYVWQALSQEFPAPRKDDVRLHQMRSACAKFFLSGFASCIFDREFILLDEEDLVSCSCQQETAEHTRRAA